MNPWEILQIEVGESDPRVIRRAYSRLLRQHRPDDDPEGFQRLRSAYEFLKAMAAGELEVVFESPEGDAVPTDEVSQDAAHPASEPAQEAELPPLPEDPRQLQDLLNPAYDRYLAGSPEQLDQLVDRLASAGRVGPISDAARALFRASESGLPHKGIDLALKVACIVAPLYPDETRALVDEAYSTMHAEERARCSFEAIDVVIEAGTEASPWGASPQNAMARIMATRGWDGSLDRDTEQLVRIIAAAGPNSALAAWCRRASSKLVEEVTRYIGAPPKPQKERNRSGAIGPWQVVAMVLFLGVIARRCTPDSDDGGARGTSFGPGAASRTARPVDSRTRDLTGALECRDSESVDSPAERWMRRAQMYEAVESPQEALRLYRRAADWGSGTGWYHVGRMTLAGAGTEANPEDAARAFRRGADLRHPESMVALAQLYREGRGVPRDDGRSLRLLRSAALLGSSDALIHLGQHFSGGLVTAIDHERAASLYRKAAEAGSAVGMYSLGVAYEMGQGVPQDVSEAKRWYQMASAAGHEQARLALTRLAEDK